MFVAKLINARNMLGECGFYIHSLIYIIMKMKRNPIYPLKRLPINPTHSFLYEA